MKNYKVDLNRYDKLSVKETEAPVDEKTVFATYKEAVEAEARIAQGMFSDTIRTADHSLSQADEAFLSNYKAVRDLGSYAYYWNAYVSAMHSSKDTIVDQSIIALSNKYKTLSIYAQNRWLSDTRNAGFGGHEFTFKSMIDGHIEKSNDSWNGTEFPEWLARLVLSQRDKFPIWEML